MKPIRFCGLLGLLIAWTVTMTASSSNAAYFTDWSASNVRSISDPNDAANGAQDITRLWYRLDSGQNYFRMDLRDAPALGANLSAPDYMIFIDSVGGGATYGINGFTDPLQSDYVAQGLSGIDEIVDGHFNTLSTNPVWAANHYHRYQGGANPPHNFTLNSLFASGGNFQSTENGGTTLEWSIPVSALQANTFTFYGAAEYIGGPSTWDITGGISTATLPEPNTLVLMIAMLGVAGVFLRRKFA